MVFTVSSPGKIILFGEHAVVHGVPAIAASVALHTYVSVKEGSGNHYAHLKFPDVSLSTGWTKAELTPATPYKTPNVSEIPTELDPEILKQAEAIASLNIDSSKVFSKTAAVAFIYLYLSIYLPWALENSVEKPLLFETRSTLPIGAGLGSSASFTTSLSAALLRAAGRLTDTTPHEEAMELVSKWSYLGECCIHGKPSGIDNVVATHGGAVHFQRNSEVLANGQVKALAPTVTPYKDFPELDMVVTDTGVARQTSELVARVGHIKTQWPSIFEALLGSFQQIVKEADKLISESKSSPDFAAKLRELADLNHGLLVTVSVSHPALEKVRDVSKLLGIGATKLTGAGGGGCAITIASTPFESRGSGIETFREKLGPGYRVFQTVLGAKGVGYAEGTGTEVSQLSDLDWKFW